MHDTLCTEMSCSSAMQPSAITQEVVGPKRIAEALDGTDLEIIHLLQEDSRRSLADIGRRVSLSPPAVKRRMDRLEADGVIAGYTVRVDHGRLGRPLEAFTELRFAGTTKVDDISTIATGLPEVHAVFTTAGDPDAIVWMRVKDVDDMKRVIDRLRRTGKVVGTKTLMVLGRWSPTGEL
jgi:Lrp/AsnC family transcriptional regulator, leucine-responsive regulatory protein